MPRKHRLRLTPHGVPWRAGRATSARLRARDDRSPGVLAVAAAPNRARTRRRQGRAGRALGAVRPRLDARGRDAVRG